MRQAVIMGESFAAACQRSVCGRVHSVFDKAVNVEIGKQSANVPRLLTLLCADSDVMPATLVTSMNNGSWYDNTGAKIGDNISLTPNVIYLNAHPVVTNVFCASVWQPIKYLKITKLPSYNEIAVRCQQIEMYIKATGRNKSVLPIMQLSDFDVTKLLGLGGGLTPSGDDFLAGMLFAMHFAQIVYGQKCDFLPIIAKAVSQNMTELTNQISQHFLSYAIEGLWGNATEQFMLSLFDYDNNTLYSAAEKKLSYGATSGMDEIFGIMFGLCETIKFFTSEP